MNGFTFFRNYYEFIKNLPEEDGNKLMRGIMSYMFDGVEPDFDGLLKAIFDSIKMGLDVSKSHSKNSRTKQIVKSTPVNETNENQMKNEKETGAKREENETETKRKREQNETQTGEKRNANEHLSLSLSNKDVSFRKGGVGEKPFLESPRKAEVEQVVEKWNSLGITQVRLPLSKGRANKVKLRVRELGLERVLEGISTIPQSKFLMGDNPKGWHCTFDWLFTNDSNLCKVLEGNYLDHDVGASASSNPFVRSILRGGTYEPRPNQADSSDV